MPLRSARWFVRPPRCTLLHAPLCPSRDFLYPVIGRAVVQDCLAALPSDWFSNAVKTFLRKLRAHNLMRAIPADGFREARTSYFRPACVALVRSECLLLNQTQTLKYLDGWIKKIFLLQMHYILPPTAFRGISIIPAAVERIIYHINISYTYMCSLTLLSQH